MNPFNDFDDDRLLTLLAEGNRDVFESIYYRYHAAIYQNVFKLTKDNAATEDIVQETFIRLWQKKNLLKAGYSLGGWLFVVSYNQSVNWLRHKLVDSKVKQWYSIHNTEPDIVNEYDYQMELLENAIRQLPPQKRRVLELCKLQGKSYQQAAEEMNISSHTVKEYLSGAMKSVRKYAVSHPEYKAMVPLFLGLFYK